jgi:hypothetical protein
MGAADWEQKQARIEWKHELKSTRGADAAAALLIEMTPHCEAALQQDNLPWTGENELLSPEAIIRPGAQERLDNNATAWWMIDSRTFWQRICQTTIQ